ncbi:putative WD repeat-containing protein 70 isoform X5 [Apostichopus japonicus]|uniref:Putative WD repeat-containing protein 70 isoform X5 n=1 Tax=Stichopus japonicus TaxID=307972 RepID=A0A2G8KZN1_STIJA|nr:putative WD repeat-containing protein 70 isoform X5 [Apostichopus japonicus]
MSDSDDDLAEMRRLRESQRYKGSSKSDDSSSKGFEEKQSSSSPVTAQKEKSSPPQTLQSDPETLSMASMMGFSGFGKKAKNFDFTEMYDQAKRSAQEKTPADQDNDKATGQPDEADDDEDDEDIIGPPLPPGFQRAESTGGVKQSNKGKDEDEDSDMEEEEEEEDDTNLKNKIPISHEITLNHGGKSVSAVTLDPSGARLVTGGYDYDVKFWDFAAMDASLKSFRTFQPAPGLAS